MADWEETPIIRVNERNLRQYAGLRNGYNTDNFQTVNTEEDMANELKQLTAQQTAQQGWEEAPKVGAPSGASSTSVDGWEEAPKEKSWYEDSPVVGAGETALTLASGGLSAIAGGLSGLGATLFGGPDAGASVMHDVSKKFTYEPRTETGKKYSQGTGEFLSDQVEKTIPLAKQQIKDLGLNITDDQAEMIARVVMETGSYFIPLEMLGALKRGKKPAAPNAKVLEEPAAPKASKTTLEGQGELDLGMPNDQVATPYNPNRLSSEVVEPISDPRLQRRQMELQLDQHPTEYIDTLGRNQHETTVFPDTEAQYHKAALEGDIASRAEQEALLRKQGRVPEVPEQSLLDFANEPKWDEGVRHADPDTGATVQGMAREVPTIDFPLRQEMLDKDMSIPEMRRIIAEQEHFNEQRRAAGATAEQMKALEETVDHLKERFGAAMESYGVRDAQDAHGLNRPLFEGGEGTRLPIEKTHNAGRTNNPFVGPPKPKGMTQFKGKKNQGGAVHPDLLTGGLSRLADKVGRQYLDPVIDRVVEAYKKYMKTADENIVMKQGTEGDRLRQALRNAEDDLLSLGVKKTIDPETHFREVDKMLQEVDKVARQIVFSDKQGGAINQQAIREGINILKQKFSRKGVPDAVAQAMAEGASAGKKPEAVLNPALQALKDSAAGKGLADFSGLDKAPEDVVKIAREHGQDIDRKWVQENIENGGIFRSIDTKHPVVIYATERLNKAAAAAQKLITDNLTDAHKGLKTYMRDLNTMAKGEVWAAMLRNEGKAVLSDGELAALGLSDKQVAFYKRFREIDDAFYNKFNEARKAAGLEEIDRRIAHIAGRFSGDFRVLAKRPKLNAEGHPVFDQNGQIALEVIGHVGANTKWELNRYVAKMKELHPDWDFSDYHYQKRGGGNSAVDRFGGMMEVVNLLSKENSPMKELVDGYKELLKSDAQKYLAADRHAKAKKAQAGGIEGSEGNKPWRDIEKNAIEGMKAQLSYFEQGYQWMEMQKASKDIGTVAGGVADVQPNAAGWANDYLNHALGKNGTKLAAAFDEAISLIGEKSRLGHTNLLKVSQKAKTLMMQKFMGFLNIPFTLTQLVQPLQTIPPMAALMKARGVDFSIAKAGMEATSSMMKFLYQETPLHDMMGSDRRTSFEKKAFEYAHDMGVFDVKMTDHMRDINSSKATDTYNWLAEANIKYPEIATRGTAFMFYAHALKELGLPEKQVFDTARNMTNVTMVDYSPMARPQMYEKMGWFGDMASTLARYKHNQVNQIAMYAREAKNAFGRSTTEGLKFSAPLMTHIATTLAMGGIVGMTGFNTADFLYRQFMSKVLDKDDSLADLVMRSKNIPEWVSHGAFAALGTDMSSRFSNAQVIPKSVGGFLVPFGSGLADVYSSTIDFAKQPNSWNAKRVVKSYAPSSMTGLIENQLFSTKNADGTYHVLNSRSGEGNYNRTEKERSMRNFGFRSMDESRELNKVFQNTEIGKAQTQRRAEIVDKAFSDSLSGDTSPQMFSKYIKQYIAAGGDPNNFAEQYMTAIRKEHMTADQRFKYQNAGNNLTAALRMQRYTNPGYNK